jgi:peptide/nickel transport system substrate-binding protein
VQASPSIWVADFPAASNFLTPTLGCRLATPGTGPDANYSRFCDRRTRTLMDRALALQPTDRTAADALWAATDRRIVDEAPVVPVLNPKEIAVVSRRTGNFQYSAQWGPLYDQMWVR